MESPLRQPAPEGNGVEDGAVAQMMEAMEVTGDGDADDALLADVSSTPQPSTLSGHQRDGTEGTPSPDGQ